jgi:hypothetical protein
MSAAARTFPEKKEDVRSSLKNKKSAAGIRHTFYIVWCAVMIRTSDTRFRTVALSLTMAHVAGADVKSAPS